MLKILLYVLAGVAAGLLGGMGMGGGTILIPLLTIFFGVDQHEAQAINLASFIPMAIVALIIHVKNKRVNKEGILWIILPAIASSLLGSYLASLVDCKMLTKFFGGFLLAVGAFQFFADKIIPGENKQKNEDEGESKDGKKENFSLNNPKNKP